MMAKYFAFAAILVAALAFTVEKREARACTSSCGSAATGCACMSCITNSSISIDVLWSSQYSCKVNVSAGYDCFGSGRLVTSTDTANPLVICGGGTASCTGLEWEAVNKTIYVGGCPATWEIQILYNDNCQQCADGVKVRHHGVTCR